MFDICGYDAGALLMQCWYRSMGCGAVRVQAGSVQCRVTHNGCDAGASQHSQLRYGGGSGIPNCAWALTPPWSFKKKTQCFVSPLL